MKKIYIPIHQWELLCDFQYVLSLPTYYYLHSYNLSPYHLLTSQLFLIDFLNSVKTETQLAGNFKAVVP